MQHRGRRVDVAGARRREVDADFHATVATPITPGELFGGYVLWIALRATLSAAAFLLVAALLGAVPSAWGVLAIPAAGLARGRVLRAARRVLGDAGQRPVVPDDHAARRAAAVPVLGHVLPDHAAARLAAAARGALAAVARRRAGRDATTGSFDAAPIVGTSRCSSRFIGAGWLWGVRSFTRRLTAVTTTRPSTSRSRAVPAAVIRPGALGAGRWRLVERNVLAYRRIWYIFLSGFVEPFLFLLSIGIGVGELVGTVPGPAVDSVDYRHVRRARAARVGRDERRAARHHVQLLRQVQVLAHLRRGARDAARHRTTSPSARSRGR